MYVEPTTVGDIPEEVNGFGPRTGLGANLFPGRQASAFAYRCFSNRGPDQLIEYGVLPGGEKAGICDAAGVTIIPGQRPGTACA